MVCLCLVTVAGSRSGRNKASPVSRFVHAERDAVISAMYVHAKQNVCAHVMCCTLSVHQIYTYSGKWTTMSLSRTYTYVQTKPLGDRRESGRVARHIHTTTTAVASMCGCVPIFLVKVLHAYACMDGSIEGSSIPAQCTAIADPWPRSACVLLASLTRMRCSFARPPL
jgi:hypothetical protein